MTIEAMLGKASAKGKPMDSPEDMLPDRRVFRLNAEQWQAFQEALNAPPRITPRLARLMREPSVFEDPALL